MGSWEIAPLSCVDPFGLSYYGDGGADFREKLSCVCACGMSKCKKAAQLASDALAEAQKRFPADSLHNGAGDAWRHCYWSCEMAKDIGQKCAKIIGDIHEDAGDRKGQPKNEREMDEHNNSVGHGLASQSGNCADLCQQALNDGKLENVEMRMKTCLLWIALVLGFLLGLTLLVWVQSRNSFVKSFQRAAKAALHSSEKIVAISAVTDFEWDTVSVFGPLYPCGKDQCATGF